MLSCCIRNDSDYLFKCLICGDASVGKSSVLLRSDDPFSRTLFHYVFFHLFSLPLFHVHGSFYSLISLLLFADMLTIPIKIPTLQPSELIFESKLLMLKEERASFIFGISPGRYRTRNSVFSIEFMMYDGSRVKNFNTIKKQRSQFLKYILSSMFDLQDRFRKVSSVYFRGAHGIVLMYDMTCRESFEHLNQAC